MDGLYAIGDIHGRSDLLAEMHTFIAEDAERHGHRDPTVVYLGDYVDRGPDSRGVLDRICAGLPGFRQVALLGNHEQMLLAFLDNGDQARQVGCGRNGGIETLASYGVPCPSFMAFAAGADCLRRDLNAAMPAAHKAFLRSLALWHETPDHVFVHGGLDPRFALTAQDPDDLLWDRESRSREGLYGGRTVVYGHSIVGREPRARPGWIGIDTGAFTSGVLTCYAADPRGPRFLRADGRTLRDTADIGFDLAGMVGHAWYVIVDDGRPPSQREVEALLRVVTGPGSGGASIATADMSAVMLLADQLRAAGRQASLLQLDALDEHRAELNAALADSIRSGKTGVLGRHAGARHDLLAALDRASSPIPGVAP